MSRTKYLIMKINYYVKQLCVLLVMRTFITTAFSILASRVRLNYLINFHFFCINIVLALTYLPSFNMFVMTMSSLTTCIPNSHPFHREPAVSLPHYITIYNSSH